MMNLSSTSIALFLALFAISSAGPVTPVKVPGLQWTSRQWICDLSGGPCDWNDSACWSTLALEYVNTFRAENGKPPLKTGTTRQLMDAAGWATVLPFMDLRTLKPRSRTLIDLGCGSEFTGGNNVVETTCATNDSARDCVDAMINDPPSHARLLTENGATAVGVNYKWPEQVICAQTFTTGTRFEPTGDCAAHSA